MAWDDAIDFAASAEQVFGAVEGSCQAPFTWNGESLDTTPIDPRSGESTVTVTVELDHQSARVNRMEPVGSGTTRCEAVLAVDGRVSVRTDDGVFDDEAAVTLEYRARSGFETFGFEVALEDLGGTLDIMLGERQSGSLTYRLSGAETSCSGEIALGLMSSQDGVGMGSRGRLASWSISGCPLGEGPVDPHAPGSGGQSSLADQIVELWGDASYPGVWDDGSATTLDLSVEIPDTMTCGENGGAVIVPVRVTYGTSDGRIEPHATDAYVDANLDVALALNIDETMRCDGTSDALPYTQLGCDELESVQIQLRINYNRDEIEFADSGLNAYEFHRGGADTGGADQLRMLMLSAGD